MTISLFIYPFFHSWLLVVIFFLTTIHAARNSAVTISWYRHTQISLGYVSRRGSARSQDAVVWIPPNPCPERRICVHEFIWFFQRHSEGMGTWGKEGMPMNGVCVSAVCCKQLQHNFYWGPTDWQLSEGRGAGDWVKKVKGLRNTNW